MKYINARKLALILLTIGVLGFFLYLYTIQRAYIENTKASYFKYIYIPLISQKLDSVRLSFMGSFISSVRNFDFSEDDPLEYTSIASSVPVLLYHGVVERSDGSNMLLQDFRDHLFALKKAGWNAVTIEDFYAFVTGEKELPAKSFLLTFDDGRKDSYYSVDPILKALNYRAVMFVITKHSFEEESTYYLTESELLDMKNSGRWDLQSHGRDDHGFHVVDSAGSRGHFLSNLFWDGNKGSIENEDEFKNRLLSDLNLSKKTLENKLGVTVISFAYPFGDYGQETVNFPGALNVVPNLVQSIYPLAFYQVYFGQDFTFNAKGVSFSTMKRITVRPDWTTDTLLSVLNNGILKDLPFSDDLGSDYGWLPSWGKVTLSGGRLVLGSDDVVKGGSAFLDGSQLWGNYSFFAHLEQRQEGSVSLMFRYQDDKNYALCNFTDKYVRLEAFVNGERSVITSISTATGTLNLKDPTELLARVVDRKADCVTHGETVVSGYLPKELSDGGIGFKTWDELPGNTELLVHRVRVEEVQ